MLKKNSGSTLNTELSCTGDPETLKQSGKQFVVLCLQVMLAPKLLCTCLKRSGTPNSGLTSLQGSRHLCSRTTWKKLPVSYICAFLRKIDTSLYPVFLFSNITDLGEDIAMPAWISYTITARGGCGKLVTSLKQTAKR